jgi:exodeoxyribonuclease VII small subunit
MKRGEFYPPGKYPLASAGVRKRAHFRMNHVNEPMPTVPRTTKTSPSAPTTDTQPVAVSYEAALEELEQLVSQLDAGQLPLDQLLTRYQRGAELLAFCRARLEAVENQIKVLEGGELKPWDQA